VQQLSGFCQGLGCFDASPELCRYASVYMARLTFMLGRTHSEREHIMSFMSLHSCKYPSFNENQCGKQKGLQHLPATEH
jgi:hypothetical protein